MAKKKKTQLKPVSRGFALTSVPKKTSQEHNTDEPTISIDSATYQDDTPDSSNTPGSKQSDSEKAEEQALQNLVDSLQEKTEKEITRNIKAIEQDRRLSKTLLRYDLDPVLVDQIIALAQETIIEGTKALEEPEDKAIAKLGVTYGTLRRLGFSEERVEECLKNINGIDLESALHWLYVNCPEEELEGINGGQTPKSLPLSSHASGIQLSDISVPASPATAATTVGAQSRPSSTPLSDIPSSADNEQLELEEVAAIGESMNESEDDDPTHEYVRLKLLHDDLVSYCRAKVIAHPPTLSKLRERIDAVKRDYLFEEVKAEELYLLKRNKADNVALRKRLQGESTITERTPMPTIISKSDKRSATQATATPSEQQIEEDDIFGGDEIDLLEMLDAPSTEITPEGITISIKDMEDLPKHWSGRGPKALLQETVGKKDRYAVVTYGIISGSSRARRASVSIRWNGQRTETWSMTEVACREENLAEQYIATVALHALSFPSADRFFSQSGSTFSRPLPPAFRDLWEELENARKSTENTTNLALWAKLRSIIEPKLEAGSKASLVTDRASKQATAVEERHPLRPSPFQSNAAERLVESVRVRQASSEYQRMLLLRNQLPISKYRSQILDILESSQVLVLSGETGCGKSTQVPAFLLEDQLSRGKHCKIYCTEPRRISAISLAQRVSQELGEPPNAVGTFNSLVGYSIRLESNTSRTTRLTFVTTGIALRMLEAGTGHGGQGTAFDDITHIIIDEVHERTIESDFLLIVLKSLLSHRNDLKVILMSATVDAEKVSAYFDHCPTLHVPGRTYPVDVRYLEDAVEMTKWQITDNSPYARRLYDKYYQGKNRPEWSEDLTPGDDDEDQPAPDANVKLSKRYSAETTATINLLNERLIPYELIVRLIEKICFEDASYVPYSSALLIFMPGLAEIRRLIDLLNEHALLGNEEYFRIYPLHSSLSSESQSAVFEIPPRGIRKIVVSTNVAETGVTIPDITCVIDTGKHREMRFDEKRQISRLIETYVAKSNAAQRRGRAGRVQQGLCFHLFTKLRHDTQMADNSLPEMLRLSLSDLALRIKIMKVKLGSSIDEVLSRALDPPASINVQRAISMLVEVRALTPMEEITPMGRLLSKLPTDVHLGKFLLIATLFRCLDPALTIAATLNSKSPFLSPLGLEQEADRAKNSFKTENSDFLTIHNAFSSWRHASSVSSSFVKRFCRTNYLSHQNLQQIEDLRQQFLGYLIDSSFIRVDQGFIRELSHARYGRYRTRFVNVPSEYDVNSSNVALLNAALVAGLYPKILSVDTAVGQLRTVTNSQVVTFHPSSVNFNKKLADLDVNYLAYFTVMHSKKLYVWETGPVDDLSLILLCGEPDFKLIADTVTVDKKIRFQISPKSNIALKLLRTQLSSLLSHQMRSRVLTESQVRWNDLAISVLGWVKNTDDHPSVIIRS
ncbi:hypothetical protein M378DRAFT_194963 [Amanita muscaria Koide BX008]|uniref:RNA helicase n=1 Tax=Amanita muscaria (strain Koide BX008) TaxID=946122 RepID=A0A0C2T488_AMAMK|nr:hypothetical protein M378DRAFT_194963 [Amanita muscaria Koide BX008]